MTNKEIHKMWLPISEHAGIPLENRKFAAEYAHYHTTIESNPIIDPIDKDNKDSSAELTSIPMAFEIIKNLKYLDYCFYSFVSVEDSQIASINLTPEMIRNHKDFSAMVESIYRRLSRKISDSINKSMKDILDADPDASILFDVHLLTQSVQTIAEGTRAPKMNIVSRYKISKI